MVFHAVVYIHAQQRYFEDKPHQIADQREHSGFLLVEHRPNAVGHSHWLSYGYRRFIGDKYRAPKLIIMEFT